MTNKRVKVDIILIILIILSLFLNYIFFQAQVRREAIKRTPGGRAEANFAVYPNREMAAAMQERKLLAAEIKIPYNGPEKSFSVNVGPQELRKIHTLLYY